MKRTLAEKFDFLVSIKINVIIYVLVENLISLFNISFQIKFPSYQYIRPGLNYRAICENSQCNKDELVIINRGYGRFKPIDDIDKKKFIFEFKLE